MAKKKLPEPYDVIFMRKKIHQMESFISEQMKMPKAERMVDRVAKYRTDLTTYRSWIHDRMAIEPVLIQERDAVRMRRLLDEAIYDIEQEKKRKAIEELATVSFGGFTVPVDMDKSFSYAEMMQAMNDLPRGGHKIPDIPIVDEVEFYPIVRQQDIERMEGRINRKGQETKAVNINIHDQMRLAVRAGENVANVLKRLGNALFTAGNDVAKLFEKTCIECGYASWATDPGDEMDSIIQYHL